MEQSERLGSYYLWTFNLFQKNIICLRISSLNSLIAALDNTDTYDKENALIDLYIFLISQNRSLPKAENTFIFVELSNWRDCSLRDGVEAYYEIKDADELNFLEKNMKQYDRYEVCKKCISGISGYCPS